MPSTDGLKRAALYVRVSTDDQAEKYGPAYQLRDLRRYADANGYLVVEEVEEAGFSRDSFVRPGFERVRQLAEAGEIDTVLAADRDRYSDNPTVRMMLDATMEPYGVKLRSIGDAPGDGPEAAFTGIVTDAAKYLVRQKTTERTMKGRFERAHDGRYVPPPRIPYGFIYEGGTLRVDPPKMVNVRRIFETVGAKGRGMNAVKKALEAEGVPSPAGSARWSISTVHRIIDNDVYLTRSYEEVAGLVSPAVAARLDREARYGVHWYGQRRTKRRYSMTGRDVDVQRNPKEEWVATPVPDSGIPPQWITAARQNVANKTAWTPNDKRGWPLRGFAYCPCGLQLLTFYNVNKGHKNIYMVCPRKRRGEDCPHARYHRAEKLERRVEGFVSGLVKNPKTLRAQVTAQIEADRRRLEDPAREKAALRRQQGAIETKRDRFQEQHAEGLMSTDRLRKKLEVLDKQAATAQAELDKLRDTERQIAELDDLPRRVESHLHELSLAFANHPLQEMAPATANSGSVSVQVPPPEEVEAERARAYQELYRLMDLKVSAEKDGTLELKWIGGRTSLQPSG